MTKQSGLGDRLYVDGVNISGDTESLSRVGGGPNPLDFTGIDKSAHERLGGVRDGAVEFTAFFNDETDGTHELLSALPTGSRIVSYCRGAAIGSPAACCRSKQINYNPTRPADGRLTIGVQAQADQYGLEWGNLLTAGIRTDTGATNGASWDSGAETDFGLQAYLHVFDFTGTDVTIKLQESSDDGSGDAFADVTGGGFAQVTGSTPLTERIQTARDQTIERYLRAVTTTSGGFTSVEFALIVVKNESEVLF